jgi:hypothetical protein
MHVLNTSWGFSCPIIHGILYCPAKTKLLRHGSHANIMTFLLIRLWFEEVQEAWHKAKKSFSNKSSHVLLTDKTNKSTTWQPFSYAVITNLKPDLRKPKCKIPVVVIKLLFLWISIRPYLFHEYRLEKKQVKFS